MCNELLLPISFASFFRQAGALVEGHLARREGE